MLQTGFRTAFMPRQARAMQDVGPITPNPGALAGKLYVPHRLAPAAPLVVVLHGCTQQATAYADAAGWLELADRHGFAVLLPQQQRANNANLCFNWFEPGDVTRGQGEVASVKAMIDGACAEHAFDPSRMFVTGLSAGAAMAGAMLATYPEIFAGGGLIAGLPYGTAHSVHSALQQMRSGTRARGEMLATHVRKASAHGRAHPRVSIWHGTSDQTVSKTNGEASVAQWLAVHRLADTAALVDDKGRHRHTRWRDADGVVWVEYHELEQMGHGTPIDLDATDAVGAAAPFVLDAGVASSVHLIDFWGIAKAATAGEASVIAPPVRPTRATETTAPQFAQPETGVTKIINDALRAAGLLK